MPMGTGAILRYDTYKFGTGKGFVWMTIKLQHSILATASSRYRRWRQKSTQAPGARHH
ncbi:hypothetical protein B0H03_10251 [Rathayibacter iranicus NCPPB 2253 = VKM Ac-1602]|uniref:Uncharacterized protein n=1 Tax=Rathayibacter iranicus NCPPB 2253 = VKM Ac-1602 TaxID=1328868 RepID=A0ABX5LET5_9MICO|nr:hypothetical protein B0H03_10251 [Rathayibacter iranicus NCPPB 2253 = VKM Ac-1602]